MLIQAINQIVEITFCGLLLNLSRWIVIHLPSLLDILEYFPGEVPDEVHGGLLRLLLSEVPSHLYEHAVEIAGFLMLL